MYDPLQVIFAYAWSYTCLTIQVFDICVTKNTRYNDTGGLQNASYIQT